MLDQHADHAARIVGPGRVGARHDRLVDAEAVDLVAAIGGDDTHPGIVARAARHLRAEIDRAGQYEAIVVVGVLADQVDAAGGLHHAGRLAVECGAKRRRGAIEQSRRHGASQ